MRKNTSHPLIERYSSWFGDKTTERLMREQRRIREQTFIRVNRSKTSMQYIKEALDANRIRYTSTFLPGALKIEKAFFSLSSTIEALQGLIYQQELASQTPIHCIDFQGLKKKQRTIRILDMAASPGSKLTQLIDQLSWWNIPYEITALEPEEKRLTKLINNLQRQGVSEVSIYHQQAQQFTSEKPFDLILLDTPCSGNLIGDRNWLQKRNREGIQKVAALQKKLLKKGSELLSSDGLLLYSTCSMEREENEENIDWCINEGILTPVSIPLKIPFNTKTLKVPESKHNQLIERAVRFHPSISYTEPFFVCCLKK